LCKHFRARGIDVVTTTTNHLNTRSFQHL
jgi:hypothetical protein